VLPIRRCHAPIFLPDFRTNKSAIWPTLPPRSAVLSRPPGAQPGAMHLNHPENPDKNIHCYCNNPQLKVPGTFEVEIPG